MKWLEKNIFFEIPSYAKNVVNIGPQPGASRGRPRKPFGDSSRKSNYINSSIIYGTEGGTKMVTLFLALFGTIYETTI